jgi:hypothetical protein
MPKDSFTLLVPHQWRALVGDYVLRVRIGTCPSAPHERRFIEFGVDPRNGQVMSTHHITGNIAQPQILEIPSARRATPKTALTALLLFAKNGRFGSLHGDVSNFGAGARQDRCQLVFAAGAKL